MISAEQVLSDLLIGKVLKKLKYEEDGGPRSEHYGKTIKTVEIGISESREDAVIWLGFEDHEYVMIYGNEGIEAI